MNREKLKPIHPGDILKTEFLATNNLTAEKLAKETSLDKKVLKKLIKEEIPISFDIATKLGTYFQTSAKFWINLQEIYEEQMSEWLGEISRKETSERKESLENLYLIWEESKKAKNELWLQYKQYGN